MKRKCWAYHHLHEGELEGPDAVTVADWYPISVLISTETVGQANYAMDHGFAAALIVKEFESTKAYNIQGVNGESIQGIPCVEQTHGIPCVKCGLCFDSERLASDRKVILFASHGARKKKVNEVLTMREVSNAI